LLKALFAASENEKYWSLTAEIISRNRASLALHKKCGFREMVIGRSWDIGRGFGTMLLCLKNVVKKLGILDYQPENVNNSN
tara:strand:- start:230 stop:472 length:243 start_codon:yes stop_codon:yes gene_type:complete